MNNTHNLENICPQDSDLKYKENFIAHSNKHESIMTHNDNEINRLVNHVNQKLNCNLSNETKQSQRYEESVPDCEVSICLSNKDPSSLA